MNENLKKQFLYSKSYSRREPEVYSYCRKFQRLDGQPDRREAERSRPLFWVKKEEMTEGKMAERASKSRPPPPPPPLAQGLDPPLINITDARNRIEFQRVHRLGKLRSSGDPRPIGARFLRYQDREEVMQKARANLKGKDYAVFLYELRKKQQNKLKRAREDGLKAFFSKKFPDKLFINGKLVPLGESTW